MKKIFFVLNWLPKIISEKNRTGVFSFLSSAGAEERIKVRRFLKFHTRRMGDETPHLDPLPFSRGEERTLLVQLSFRKLLSAAVLILGIATASVSAAPDNELISRWLQAQSSIHTWTADVTQTREMKALTQPLTATGKIWFAAPDRFRWEIEKPSPTIAVRDNDELLVIFPKLKRAERYSLAKLRTGPWKDLMQLMDTGFPRNQKEFEARFRIVSLVNSNDRSSVFLEPKSMMVRKIMPRVSIAFGTTNLMLRATEMTFTDGSKMKNEFTNAKLNPKIDEELFHPKLGSDYQITEPLGAKP